MPAEKPEIVFATNNAHKLSEIREIVGREWHILSLDDIGCHADIPETAPTFEGNARQKAEFVKEHFGYECFADDSGLVVDSLGGAPGVMSARYAGPGHDSEANMKLLLENMRGIVNRRAHFTTCIALTEPDGNVRIFEGKIDGRITLEPRGSDGFGYDPVFQPEGSELTFAQMSHGEKNAISHRGRAMAQLIAYLSRKD